MRKYIEQIRLKKYINEDGAVGATDAGGIASCSMPLFASMVKRPISAPPRVIKYSSKTKKKHKKVKNSIGIKEAFDRLAEDLAIPGANSTFDTTGAIAKLKSMEDKERVDRRNTTTFGLVDNNGGIVKVTIPTEQAQSFEQDIEHLLGEKDRHHAGPEIAEVLFKLKDRYTIVDVDWPAVEEDDEEGQELAGGASPQDEVPPEGSEDVPPAEDIPPEGEMPPGPPAEDVQQVSTLLTQVIDMMRADAQARKAEAQAREAEANTKQAAEAKNQAMARVRQEEQFLDMEEHQKAQRARDKEAKRLAQLAKWGHEVDRGKEQDRPAQEPQYGFTPDEYEQYKGNKKPYPNEEEEESTYNRRSQPMRGKVNSSDIAKYIMSRTK